MTITKMSRRNLLALTAAAPLARPAYASPASDTQVQRALRDWTRVHAHLMAQNDEAFDAGCGELYAMSNAILDLPSQSAEDTIAKLMALTNWCGDLEGIFPCNGDRIILKESRALLGFAPSP